MKVISSQHHIDWDIVEEKMQKINGLDFVEIPCWSIGEVDGEEMAIQADGHHTLAAARELGVDVRFTFSDEPEGLTGEDAMNAHWNGGDWYDVESSNPAYDQFDLIW